MLLVIDNYDSFTYNLVQLLGALGAEVQVFRNDALSLDDIRRLAPTGIVISPGPGTPQEAGVSLEVIRHLYTQVPILGVCLGHQAIAQVFGGRVARAARLMHGKTSPIVHHGRGLFAGLPQNFPATRYHSLLVYEPLPPMLEVTARTPEGEVMALRHRTAPLYGVQFHPESVYTPAGPALLRNFLRVVEVFATHRVAGPRGALSPNPLKEAAV